MALYYRHSIVKNCYLSESQNTLSPIMYSMSLPASLSIQYFRVGVSPDDRSYM